jgi:hypothetical protein
MSGRNTSTVRIMSVLILYSKNRFSKKNVRKKYQYSKNYFSTKYQYSKNRFSKKNVRKKYQYGKNHVSTKYQYRKNHVSKRTGVEGLSTAVALAVAFGGCRTSVPKNDFSAKNQNSKIEISVKIIKTVRTISVPRCATEIPGGSPGKPTAEALHRHGVLDGLQLGGYRMKNAEFKSKVRE